MEQINECLKCIELKKSLQLEKKKVSQKNRLITLLRELVRSYEAKDLNLTFTDLSRIYESSSSEVTILKQRLTLYLNENQELLQLKNEISSRNNLLEKKYRDVEDEISHLRFVNKQLSDYYREKEADHDQHKDRLKKLARKLLCYEPKNSEVRKILNLQNTPIELEPKPSKNGHKKKNEENLKDMKKDNIVDDDLTTMKSKPSDILSSEELDLSGISECDNDTDYNETNNFSCIEEGSHLQSPELVLSPTKVVERMSDGFIPLQSLDDKLNSEKSCEIISNQKNGVKVTCEESNGLSNCVGIIDDSLFYKNISEDASSVEIHENSIKSSEVLPSIFEEDNCTYEEVSEQNEINANHKDLNDFLVYEDSLPDLISPLKSDESRVLSYLDCNQTLQHDSGIQENSDHVDSNQEVTENGVDDRNEKESTDIKNECSSNSGDQIDKKKKSPRSTFQSKYQTLSDDLLFTEKPINNSQMPLNGNYASNYQFQSSHCFGCCNNSFDARTPITLKLYNCTNVEISIPPVMQKQSLPIITVRDKCDLDKCCSNTSNDINKINDPSAMHCSFISDKRNEKCNDQRLPNVLTCSRPWLNRSNHNTTENIKEPSNPYFQDSRDGLKNSDYYFLDYLTNNKVSVNNSTTEKEWFGESDSDTIKCNRLFPIRVDKQFDLEHFCYRFESLSLKYSLPEQACKVSTSDKMNSTNKYSSLFNISQPPVFHNSLKNSLSSHNRNEWIFGQSFLNGTTKQDLCHKTATMQNILLSRATEENSVNKLKCNIVQKSVLSLKNGYINRTNINGIVKNKVPANKPVQNPFHNINKINEFKGTEDCFKPTSFHNSRTTMFDIKEKSLESGKMILFPSCSKPLVENNKVQNEDLNHKLFRNNPFKIQNSQSNGKNPSVSTVTSKSGSQHLVSNNEDSSKSIFDFDQGKDVSTGNSNTHSSIYNNKTKFVSTSHGLYKEGILDQIQTPTSVNSYSRDKVVSEVQSKSQVKEHRKENLLRERPLFLKEKSPKKIKRSELPQSKTLSDNHENLFKKPNSVNIKATSHSKINENKFECNPVINKEVEDVLNGKSKVDSPKKIDQLSKLNKNKPSPDFKRNCSKKMFAQQNGCNEEPKSSTGSILKPGAKRVVAAHKKTTNISHIIDTDEEEEKKIDNELQEIFKEMIHTSVPLLAPLTITPEISAEETPGLNEVKEIGGNSEENSDLEKNDKIINSKEEFKTKFTLELEDEKINSSLEIPIVNEENISKCDITSNNGERVSLDEGTNIDKDNLMNVEDLEDMKTESCTEIVVSSVNGEVLESEEIKIYSRKRKKPTDDPNEAENNVCFTSSTECKSKISEEIIPTLDYHCSSKDVELHADDEVEPLSTANVNKPYIGPGFYVNRSDDESTSNPSVPLISEISKVECSTIFNDPNPDVFNAEDIPPLIDHCNPEDNSVLHTEEVVEGKEIPLETQESMVYKRKLDESNEHIEGMCSKKQKMLSDDEYISCESDVFICALRYLSAVAVASFDGNVCNLAKPNSDVNLATKIAINHIKNLITEGLQSIDSNVYDVLNCSIKKIKQINDASPASLAKAIIELIVESNDKSEAKDKPYMPSMSKTIKMCLLTAVSFIGYNRDFVMKFCEVFEQYISSFYDKSLTVAEGSQLVIFYTSFCRSYNLDDKVKYLIYDVMYTRNIKAYPMVYKTIQTWPDILPHSETCYAKDCLLTQTIIFILLSGASSVDDKVGNMYCISNIRSYLYKYFGYKCNFIRREELTDKIIENIATKGGSVALVLLCKCEPWEWSLNIVEKKLLPILHSRRPMNESTICEYILAIARIVRGFPITKAAHIVKNTLEIFETMLLESNSTHLSEIIVEAISLLRRHNLMKCTAILMNWKPNTKQVTKKTINHISSILRVKNVGYWRNVYSAHSSNIIHNTRTFRKKKKPGFLNPP